jgi:hypothetical protein
MGTNAFAAGPGDLAIGQGARVEADNSSAFGAGATVLAGHTNSTAIGAGATTTRANQVMVGTSGTTYTTPGITSNASKAAQGSPTHIVTSNAGGDLAAYTPSELGIATSSQHSVECFPIGASPGPLVTPCLDLLAVCCGVALLQARRLPYPARGVFPPAGVPDWSQLQWGPIHTSGVSAARAVRPQVSLLAVYFPLGGP